MAESVINPYEFLGVNETSTMSEVRRAFFQLSLVCHPDKGGDGKDMRTLQSAYEWIGHHIETVRERGDETYEQKEENFKAFLESQQEEKILPWDEVLQSGLVGCTFDELYDRCCGEDVRGDDYMRRVVSHLFFSRLRCSVADVDGDADVHMDLMKLCINDMKKAQEVGCYSAAVPDGYGEFMLRDEDDADVDGAIPETKSFGRHKMIVYQEPSALSPPRPVAGDAIPIQKLDDYSVGTLCDYRLAYQDTDKPLEELTKSMEDQIQADVNARFLERRDLYSYEDMM